MRSRVFDLQDHMTLIASGTGCMEFFLTAQGEGNSQREQTNSEVISHVTLIT